VNIASRSRRRFRRDSVWETLQHIRPGFISDSYHLRAGEESTRWWWWWFVWYLSLSQWCCWRFKASGMWRWVYWCMVTDVSNELPAFSFRVTHSVDCWRVFVQCKCLWRLTSRYRVASQKVLISDCWRYQSWRLLFDGCRGEYEDAGGGSFGDECEVVVGDDGEEGRTVKRRLIFSPSEMEIHAY